ncbi:hypothetical protein D3C85_1663560 [compost metagenome]
MPRAKRTDAVPTDKALVQDLEDGSARALGISPLIAAPYGRDRDRELIAQFAVGLLRDGTGSYDADDVALRNRTKDALNRARVMLEEFKKFEV